MRRRPIRSAVAAEYTFGVFPLCTIARRNKPLARGIVRSVATLMAPANSPKIVTLVGSPPIAAMSLHPFERRDLIEKTQVGEAVTQVDEAFGAHPVTDGDAHDPIAGEPARGSRPSPAAPQP